MAGGAGGDEQGVAEWLPRLEQEGIHGADAIFACLGSALEVYSRYERVETAGGEVIPLEDVRNGNGQVAKRGNFSYVWEAVAREALKVIFPEADPSGFEEDARLTAVWLWTLRAKANGAVSEDQEEMLEEEEAEDTGQKKLSGYALPYDDARLIIQALGAHEDRLKRPGGIMEVKGDTARLLPVAERRRFLLGDRPALPAHGRLRRGQRRLFEEMVPEPEEGVTVEPGQSTLDRLHQAMFLFAEGRSNTLRWFLVDEGVGRVGNSGGWRTRCQGSILPPPRRSAGWTECWPGGKAWGYELCSRAFPMVPGVPPRGSRGSLRRPPSGIGSCWPIGNLDGAPDGSPHCHLWGP